MTYQKIAIVKLSAMGDIIHSMTALQFIKEQYPYLQIDWFVESTFSQVLQHNPHIDNIYELNLKSIKKSFKNLFREYKKIKKFSNNNYDLVIDAQGLIKSSVVAKLLCKNVAGFDKNSIREKAACFFYSKRIAVAYESNVIDRAVILFNKALDFTTSKKQILQKEGFLFYKDEDKVINSLKNTKKKNIVFIIGASWESKKYDDKKFVTIIKNLNENALIVSGSEVEAKSAEYICKNSSAYFVPKIDLNTLKALIDSADLIIGNDTGPTHMAWAMNKPSITLFGNTPGHRNTYATTINKVIESDSKVDPNDLDKKDFSIKTIDENKIISLAKELLKDNNEQ